MTAVWFPIASKRDYPGYSATYEQSAFASAHIGAYNMAFCDGSVRLIGYTINGTVHARLANRKDGHVIDATLLAD